MVSRIPELGFGGARTALSLGPTDRVPRSRERGEATLAGVDSLGSVELEC